MASYAARYGPLPTLVTGQRGCCCIDNSILQAVRLFRPTLAGLRLFMIAPIHAEIAELSTDLLNQREFAV